MLDKSIPYANVFMCRKKGNPIPEFPLPDGFKFVFFQPGDEKAWAKIETSVSEFDSEQEALAYFKEEFAPGAHELRRRCVFIENEKGEKIATSTAWWNYTGTRRDPWLHWVAVMPQYQGLGLGKSISAKATQLLAEIEGDNDFYLKTQTWSHRAIKIYEKIGYCITDEKYLGKYVNEDYEKALAVLSGL
ncbi:MAG: GNAT family N-acetyltransferase [Defluviitaleaceae bacterium]|nr:GNAT family N-acetyltransferase [Defluviitaleaceae bacterium]